MRKMERYVLTADLLRPPRLRWLIKRSRAASILLIGWLFFWIGGIVQPCCMAFAASLGDDRVTTQAASKGDTDPVGLVDILGHENDQCPQTVSADRPLLGQFSLLLSKVDHTPHLVVVSHLKPLLAISEFSIWSDPYHPPALSRIYLRTQRFLI
jgi:hypothetical protein